MTQDYLRAGRKAARFAGEEAALPWLIYGGEESYGRSGVKVLSWRTLAEEKGIPEIG